MKKLRVMAGALVSSLALSMAAGSAMAADGVTEASTLEIGKTITVTEGESIPAAEFGFTILPATVAPDTEADGLPVERGVDLKGDVEKAKFTGTEQVTEKDGKKVAEATTKASYDFADKNHVDYTGHENTVQRYVVSEMDTDVPGITKDAKQYILDVYVGEDASVKYLVGHTTTDGTTLGDKAPIVFNNEYASKTLTISKSVVDTTGFASDDEFEFTLTVTTPNKSGVTALSAQTLSKEGTPVLGSQNPTSVTPGQQVRFTLGDGDKFVVSGLPAGSTYSVDETDAEGYTTKVSVDGTDKGTDAVQNETLNDNTTVAFTNTRTEITPTGVVMAVAPYVVALAVVAGAGAWFVARRVKKQA